MDRVVGKYLSVLVLCVYACTFPVLEVTHLHKVDVERRANAESSIPRDHDSSDGRIPYSCPVCIRIHSSLPPVHFQKQFTQIIPVCSVPIDEAPVERGVELTSAAQRAPPASFC